MVVIVVVVVVIIDLMKGDTGSLLGDQRVAPIRGRYPFLPRRYF
jgi:hypothetical protein